MEKIIDVNILTKDYGFGRGIFDVSLDVYKGETLCYLGPNGAGKTTTIRQLVGFQSPQSGKAEILGLDCFLDRCKIMENIGYLPGEVNFPQGLKARDVLAIVKQIKEMKGNGREAELINLFPVDLNANTKKMSVGERRKLAIIVAFISDPDVLILDEPSSGLDPVMQRTFIDFILDEKKKGKTILLSSHMFDEVGALCERISIIKEGRIIKELKSLDIKRPTEKTYEITFADLATANKFSKEGFDVSVGQRTNSVQVIVADNNINKLIDVLANYNIVNFIEKKFDLENYFLNFYKSTKTFTGV